MSRTVTLDKNAGSKKLRKLCNEENEVRCILLPHDMRDAADPEVLEFGKSNNYLILTFDKPLFSQCSYLLADNNPGLLLLREDDAEIRQMNSKRAPSILKRFKQEFPEWHLVPWSNSYVEMTPTLIYIYCTYKRPVLVGTLTRNDSGWQKDMKELLEKNASSALSLDKKQIANQLAE